MVETLWTGHTRPASGDRQDTEQLRTAFSAGQLHLEYQPIYDRSLAVVSAETLVGWRHPDRGLVAAAQLRPMARQLGLTEQLASLVIRRAVKDLAEWRTVRPEMELSFNIEPTSASDPRFVKLLWLLLTNNTIFPQHVVLELPVHQLNNTHKIARSALRLSVDGWPSHEPVVPPPHANFAEVKVEFAFKDLAVDELRRQVLRGHERQLRMVAMGLETDEDIDTAQRAGFDRLQGSGLSRPVSREQLTGLLITRRS